MGFQVKIDGAPLEVADYSVQEASSPLAAGDSSGGVGSFSVTIPLPDDYVATGTPGVIAYGYGDGPFGEGLYGGGQPAEGSLWRKVRSVGPEILIGKSVRIFDSRKGFTLGSISSVDSPYDGGVVTLSGSTRLSTLNVYGIQAQPFVGTLGAAFEYYLGLANVTDQLFVEDDIATRPVVMPGWNGELWYYLKLMAAAEDCDISLVSGVILLRAIRKRVATRDRDTSRAMAVGGETLAQSIEVYQYNNRPIVNELVYPPGGWNSEVEVLNVNAGETIEYTLDISASVSSIQAPTMQTFVSQDHDNSSTYTVVADDGLPVPPALWRRNGGRVVVTIEPETTKLKVSLVGAVNIPNSSGTASQNFSLALGSDTTGNRYSTLRILGTGVAFEKAKKKIRTGVPASRTATDVGVTIDNPFISTTNQLYSAGTRAARKYAGAVMSLTGTVTAINRRGDTGQAQYPTYGEVQERLESEIPSPTYGSVSAYYASGGLTTYEMVRGFWFEAFRDDDADQVFGNVQGARVYDRRSRRWYRVRTGDLSASTISFTADDDLTHDDISGFYAGKTYHDVLEALDNGGFSYAEVERIGLYHA